jgi:cytochrome c oxidase subunit 3
MTTLPAHNPADVHGHGEHAHNDGHDHSPFLAHHWDTPKQQFEAGKLGMWLFLTTEVLLFGGLFCAYAVWRSNHPELFKYGSHYLNTTLGAVNTAVLIVSSLTMAWGVTAAQQNKQGLLKLMLLLTLAGAATFLVIKYFEYTHKFQEGLFPGLKFYEKPPHAHMWVEAPDAVHDAAEGDAAAAAENAVATGPAPTGFEISTVSVAPVVAAELPPAEASTVPLAARGPQGLATHTLEEPKLELVRDRHEARILPLQDPQRPHYAQMFFTIYYMMTGLHGIHVVVGMIVIIWLLIKTFKGHFSSEYFTPVDLGGLYWHVVDLIWIFLFPLFYLI